MTGPDEFYVGYLPAPTMLGRRLRRMALALLLLAGPAGILVAWAHTPSEGGRFAFGHPSVVSGEIELSPTPAIRERRGSTIRRIPLVGPGKHGVTGLDGLNGRAVRATVTRIARGGQEMYELAAISAADSTAAPLPAVVTRSLGFVTYRGEIVDGKCDLGVMNPGDGLLHRACAVRCLSGGVPPMLLIRDASGAEVRVALSGLNSPLPADLVRRFAGAAVEVRGWLVQRDDTPLLQTSVEGIRRIP